MCKRVCAAIFLWFLIGVAGPVKAQTITEIEPNETCQTAQDVSSAGLPFTLTGNMAKKAEVDTDYFKVTGIPGSLISINVKPVDPKMLATSVAVYESGCIGVPLKFASYPSAMVAKFPKNGVFIVNISKYSVEEIGAYSLSITPESAIGSISGHFIDAVTQQPLTSVGIVSASLHPCKLHTCGDYVSFQSVNKQGAFKFSQADDGTPLIKGDYKIVGYAEQYEALVTSEFFVDKAQHKQVNLSMKSYPARVDMHPCKDIPSKGGLCKFTVTVTNGQAKNLSAVLWNIVDGRNINVLGQGTQFPVLPFTFMNLAKGAKKTFNFAFNVPASVRNNASIDVAAFVGGTGNHMGFNMKGYSNFGMKKLANTTTLQLSPESEMVKHRRQLSPVPLSR